ncbi:hypothetical protein [Georgenia faecalis]|uniref:Secreted protein n=1 Tax=Georgenia faecalis TaxID=2483799 RepID=A0ABV9D8K3_9MICO|nr:hypothetical protein [Georgenia faecalis]
MRSADTGAQGPRPDAADAVKSAWRRRGGALALAVLLAGCTASTAPEQQPATGAGRSATSAPPTVAQPDDPATDASRAAMSPAQAAEISDGEVTAEEYDASFARYRECLSAGGFELSIVDSVDGRHHYTVPGEAVSSGVDPACYEAEYAAVDALRQTSDQA